MSSTTAPTYTSAPFDGFWGTAIPGLNDVAGRAKEIAKGNKKEIFRTGGDILKAQTAAAMISNVPTVMATGAFSSLFTNTIAQPLITTVLGAGSAATMPVTLGLGAAAGVGYLGYKRRKWINEMRAKGASNKDILTEDMANLVKVPTGVAARGIWEGVNLGTGLINNIMMEGSPLEKKLDTVIARGKGTYSGDILEPVDKALGFIERITNFNPAHAFIPDKEKKKTADKGDEGGKDKK